MSKRTAEIVDISGQITSTPDFPIAVVRRWQESENSLEGHIVDPVFDYHVTKNLYGRIMTLVEATSDTHKLKAVKDLFSKELMAWENDVYRSARQLAGVGLDGRDFAGPSNIYTR
jgi:hypothetical protein